MHYLITGGTGFIGSALIQAWKAGGHQITVLTRKALPQTPGCHYLTDPGDIPSGTRFDAVVNLAGASLAGARWSASYKQEIIASRLDTTRSLVDLLGRLEHKPEVLLSASAIGYYGHQGDNELAEDSATVPGFSHDLCRHWEEAALAAGELGVRVCLLRLGVVLDHDGGAMLEMARPFRFGVANWLGSGRQWLSWVHRRDVVAAILFLQEQRELSGAFNITAPDPVTSRGFCRAMKQHRRTLITAPVPAFAMRLLVGEMADELLLNGQKVLPIRLQQAGFEFSYAELNDALADILQAI